MHTHRLTRTAARERTAAAVEAPTPPARPAPRRAPPPPPRGAQPDPAALFVLLDGLRRAAPRELEQQVTSLIREFLLTLRSLIDWYLERLDRPDREPRGRGHPDRVESIGAHPAEPGASATARRQRPAAAGTVEPRQPLVRRRRA